MEFEPVIGGVHAQLLTESKMFCCSANYAGAAPNTTRMSHLSQDARHRRHQPEGGYTVIRLWPPTARYRSSASSTGKTTRTQI